MPVTEKRELLVNHIRNELIGSHHSPDKLVGENPLDRFVTGFLFPISQSVEEQDENTPDDYSQSQEGNSTTNATSITKHKRYLPPSSAGLSFYITGMNLKLRVFHKAVFYKQEEKTRNPDGTFLPTTWEKNNLAADGEEITFTPHGKKNHDIFDKKGKVCVLWRKHANGYIVTVTLLNKQKISDTESGRVFINEQNKKSIFEVEFSCIIESGDVGDYPSKHKALLSDEEKEIELRYKDQHTYAVGHGVAANWKINSEGKREIWADFMPVVEVPQVTADTAKGDNSKVLEFEFLSKQHDENYITQLEDFVGNYEKWINKQVQKAEQEDADDRQTAHTIIKKQKLAKKRMLQGIEILKTDTLSMQAFATMNEAMLMQWVSNDANKGVTKKPSDYKWRPFQLAFILMTLESTINADSEYRDTVDLIWFPTGGGKTEAYLGQMAFLFLYRRLKYSASSGGTVAIMRYTLRLLTTQQFVRANKVIFALELIRRDDPKKFGKESFTSGLWVGGASSPNTYYKTNDIIKKEQYSKLVVTHCPWCDEKFLANNYVNKENSFHLICTNKTCDFGGSEHKTLPCNVVDEALYQSPPTLVIATVDKFAQLAWDERAGNLFDKDGNRPPELIIQDELHLISSALGSIVGLYEAGIDTALISRGMHVKYIASTATIKHAKKQVKSLFAKEMLVFPPAGLRYEDSYFAKTVPLDKKPGRLYIGYLAPLLSRQKCLIPLAGSLLAAPNTLFGSEEEYLDSWWTQTIYHGSLKGVTNSRTLYQGGISSYLEKKTVNFLKEAIEEINPKFITDDKFKTVDDFLKIDDPEIKQIVEQYLPVRDLNVKSLTSQLTAEENAETFNNLVKGYNKNDSIDVALATNMISVGLDVSRLALMIINGQPLTTAEYIQASSRVGRGKTPGLVFVNFYKTQARSLSHYENFRSYHEAFYRYVEPSSLTPFTLQARQRALHAALIIAIRHGDIGLQGNEKAGDFDSNQAEVKKVVNELKIRCKLAIDDKENILTTHEHIDTLLKDWQGEIDHIENNKGTLHYSSKDRGISSLICRFDENSKSGIPWKTLNSMRSVENTALIKLLKGVKLNED